jgi:hypothetical protein
LILTVWALQVNSGSTLFFRFFLGSEDDTDLLRDPAFFACSGVYIVVLYRQEHNTVYIITMHKVFTSGHLAGIEVDASFTVQDPESVSLNIKALDDGLGKLHSEFGGNGTYMLADYNVQEVGQ